MVFDPLAPGGFDFLLRLQRELPRVRRVVYVEPVEAGTRQAYGLAHATLTKLASDAQLRSAVLGYGDSREFRTLRTSGG